MFAWLILSLCLASSSAYGQTFVKPGDTVQIPLPIKNAADSGAIINNAQITIAGLPGFVTNVIPSPTDSIPVGTAKTFTPSFVVDPNAQDGSYTVTLKTIIGDVGIDPDPDTIELVLVDFKIDRTPPKVAVSDLRGAVAEGKATNGEGLEVIVDDTLKQDGLPAVIASGPGKIETYRGDPVPENLISVNNAKYVDRHVYAPSELGLGGLPEGRFTIIAYDQAGNSTTACFTIDRTPPYIMVNDVSDWLSGAQDRPVYVSPETITLSFDDDRDLMCAGNNESCNKVSGIKSITLFKDGLVTDMQIFERPKVVLNTPPMALDEGNYVLEVVDAAGNKTTVPIISYTTQLVVSTAASNIDMDRNGDAFSGTLHIAARSGAGLASLVLFDWDLKPVYFRRMSREISQTADIPLVGTISDFYNKPRTYGIGFSDAAGNLVFQPVTLNFGRQQEYMNNLGSGGTQNYDSPVLDLLHARATMLPGAVMSAYFPSENDLETSREWWWGDEGTANGSYGSATVGVLKGKWDLDENARQPVGTVQVLTRTWDKPDGSDAVPYVTADRNIYRASLLTPQYPCFHKSEDGSTIIDTCAAGYTDSAPADAVYRLKRFVQTSVTLTKNTAPIPAVPAELCREIHEKQSESDTRYCTAIYDMTPSVLIAGPPIHGFKVKMDKVYRGRAVAIPAGHNITVDLPDGMMLNYGLNTVFSPGMLYFSYGSVNDYPGYKNLKGNLALKLETQATFDNATISIPYDPAGLSAAQEAGIKIFKITGDGAYIALETTVDTVNKKAVSAAMSSFGRMMIAAPAYANPVVTAGAVTIGGRPELEFTADGAAIAQSVYNAGTPEGAVLLSAVAAKGTLAGNIYLLDPGNPALAAPGALKLRYDASALAAAGIKTLSVYRANPDGSCLQKLSEAKFDSANHELAVDVWRPSGLFMLVGSNATEIRDTMPPVASISYGEPYTLKNNQIYISSLTPVTLTGVDPAQPGDAPASGLKNLQYLIDASPTLSKFQAYTAPLTLEEGVRTVYYSAVDNAGNISQTSSATFYVDGRAPETALTAAGVGYVPGGIAYITNIDTVAITADDPVSNGVASGVKTIYRLVDVLPSKCDATDGTAPEACQTANYNNTPFVLSVGLHTVYFSAEDNVGNRANIKSVNFVVSQGNSGLDSVPPTTHLLINDQELANGATANTLPSDKISITASDDGSGLAGIYYTLDTPISTASAVQYSAPFALTGGSHTVYYTAIDNAGNSADVKSANINVFSSVYSSVKVDGNSEVSFVSPFDNASIALVQPNSAEGAPVLAAAASQNLQRVSNLYRIGPDGDYPPNTVIAFRYSPSALPSGVTESQIRIWEHTVSGWTALTQNLDAADHKISATVTHIGSLFAIFAEGQTPPPPTVAAADLQVAFTPNYAPITPPLNSAEIAVNFTPNYTPVTPPVTAAELAVNFTPAGYPQISESYAPDRVVDLIYENAAFPAGESSVTVAKVAAADSAGVLALSVAAGEQLTPIGGLYDLTPKDTVFTPEATLFFNYDEMQLAGADEATLNVYRYNGAAGSWELLPALARNTDENWISVKTAHLCLYGVFHSAAVTPAAFLKVKGMDVASGSTAYITTADSITITGNAPVVRMLYTVDASFSTGTATTYTLPFTLEAGTRTVYYAAFDGAANQSEVKSAVFNVSPSQTQAALPISPSSGPIGIPFTIEGTGFGTYSAGTTVALLGGATAPLTLWTDTKIQGTIPGALAAGQYPVSVKRGAAVLAEVSPFTVTQPALYALDPSSGAIGIPFTITGESFGNYVANYTRVLIGGATVPLTLWTDTKIQGTIPGNLVVGDQEVVVERALNGGVVRSSTTTFSLRGMEAYWLAPSSGPIGMPFTITGAGFGNYSSVYTHVLIGDTTAPLTLWTDGKIQGTVPGSLVSGQYPVLVERRTADGGLMQTAPMSFEVVNVDVASMTPVAGPIGLPFTIYGGNFGNYVADFTRVLIGGTTCPLTLWTADKIQGNIPGALGPGEYPVVVERELNGGVVQSQALTFAVSTPAVYNISPASGPIGIPFTINGANFGNYSAAYMGVLINGATVPLTLWTDTKIQGTIPGNLAPGQYPVVVGRMTADGGAVQSEALSFTVIGVDVASMTPVSGPIAMPFTIFGTGFGNYSAGLTKVLIGGTTCPLTLWTDTKIQGTVPGSLNVGDYQVVVERNLNGGQVQSLPLAFSVTAPAAYTLAPSSGPIGLPFTINGASFGNYVANYTRVLIGGAAAPLTLWTDTKIQGTIPGSLAAGEQELVIERALNGGIVRTSTFSFTVGAPAVDTVSPSTASVIAPFTLTGYNFGNYAANYTKVLVNGTTAQVTLWTDNKIQGKLPFLLAGTYPVQVQRSLNGGLAESTTVYINVEEPAISSMTPLSGAAGTVFNIYGTGFGPYDAAIAKVFIGEAQCAISLWTDTRITGTVPSGVSYGTHTVVAARGLARSNGLEFYTPGGYSPSRMPGLLIPADLEFKLGDVYVYPDPAKGGKAPIFHIEVGMADTVKLKIFTVAGEMDHAATITGIPQGIGSTYAYEYAWEGHIASGVYYYTIEAERTGKKIRAKGKFSVIR